MSTGAGSGAWIGRTSSAVTVLVACACAVLSWHGLTMLGESVGMGALALLLPVVIDGSMLVGTLHVLHASLSGLSTAWGWTMTMAGVTLSTWGNVMSAPELTWTSAIVHAVPSLALAVSVEASMRIIRHGITHRADTPQTVPATLGSVVRATAEAAAEAADALAPAAGPVLVSAAAAPARIGVRQYVPAFEDDTDVPAPDSLVADLPPRPEPVDLDRASEPTWPGLRDEVEDGVIVDDLPRVNDPEPTAVASVLEPAAVPEQAAAAELAEFGPVVELVSVGVPEGLGELASWVAVEVAAGRRPSGPRAFAAGVAGSESTARRLLRTLKDQCPGLFETPAGVR